MADIFISYSGKDEARVADMHTHLRGRGFDVWWMKDIPPGASPIQAVSSELESATKVVLAWSRNAALSPYVEGEIMHAVGARKLVPVRIEKWAWPAFLASVQYVDLTDTDDKQEAWRRIEARLHGDASPMARVPAIAVPRSAGPVGFLLGTALVLAAALLGFFALSDRAIETGDTNLLQLLQYFVLTLPLLAAVPLVIAAIRLWGALSDRPQGRLT